MEIKLIKSIKDDFCESSGPSTTTHIFLSIDGILFELGKFYCGPYMQDGTQKRLNKISELEAYLSSIEINQTTDAQKEKS